MKIERKFVNLDNLKLSYLEAGEGEPLLLIHGIFSEATYFRKLIKILQKHYKIYALDLPMHGKSETPKDYLSVPDLAKLLEKFLQKIEVDKPILAALSGGALIAINFCKKNQVKELILINPAGLSYHKTKREVWFAFFIKRNILKFFRHPIKRLLYAPYDFQGVARNLFNKNYRRLLDENINRDYTENLQRLACPITILWAKYDELISLSFAEKYKSLVPQAKLIIVNGTHDWPLTRPEEILKYIKLNN